MPEEKSEHQKEFEETLKRMANTSKEEFERKEQERKEQETREHKKD